MSNTWQLQNISMSQNYNQESRRLNIITHMMHSPVWEAAAVCRLSDYFGVSCRCWVFEFKSARALFTSQFSWNPSAGISHASYQMWRLAFGLKRNKKTTNQICKKEGNIATNWPLRAIAHPSRQPDTVYRYLTGAVCISMCDSLTGGTLQEELVWGWRQAAGTCRCVGEVNMWIQRSEWAAGIWGEVEFLFTSPQGLKQ